MAGNAKPAIVKSASRTLDIIEFIVNSAKPPTFTAIQEFLDIPKSSLSYLLQELANRDYIQFDADTRVYYPGAKLIKLSASCINNTNLSREIWLGIKRLSDELGETTQAGLLEGRFVVYIAKCQGRKDISVTTVGFKIPAHATALGKMMLSALSEDELKARLDNVQLERYTENTIVSYDQLLAELKQIARQGYAIDNQEIIPGGICVAAPIFDKSNKVVAAMSVTVPAIRATDEFLQELIDKVRAAAINVSLRLGKI
ncbi:IclR family transcriptional regulator [Sporolituus thermophilus]|uniref:Transcriptional regulator, IclR family n=1 Tax=Sporolituus thermophilus DSM 23256 TaxID=1123285 RepID=A0A1G7P9N3_9FIRM|nr:IclR family transcriptional regulator [Sporolituus thermophilus]SDF82309.1 transcriptional regulator, IclR family [Sporolituus thermophilus DSM 23256]